MTDFLAGPLVQLPFHLGSVIIPYAVSRGFMLAAFLFASAYLANHLQRQ